MDYKRRKIEWNEKYPDVVILLCTDGEVAMSNGEFESLLDAGNILRHLVYGAPGMRKDANFDVFRRFHVTKAVLNGIRACVRGNGDVPCYDLATHELLGSGELRHYADALGGFDAVNTAVQTYEKEDYGMDHPEKDVGNKYEWRIIQTPPGFLGIEMHSNMTTVLNKKGYVWVSTDDTVPNKITHVYRRLSRTMVNSEEMLS